MDTIGASPSRDVVHLKDGLHLGNFFSLYHCYSHMSASFVDFVSSSWIIVLLKNITKVRKEYTPKGMPRAEEHEIIFNLKVF